MTAEQQQISQEVEEMFERTDAAIFEVMHRLADIALEQTIDK